MHCSKYDSENPPENSFCAHCGSALARTCAKCGADKSPTSNFCGKCGAPLSAPAHTPVSATPPIQARDEAGE